MSNSATTTIITNAARLGHTAQVAAWGIALSVGLRASALCCWCAEKHAGDDVADTYRVPRGGECSICPAIGQDVLVAVFRA